MLSRILALWYTFVCTCCIKGLRSTRPRFWPVGIHFAAAWCRGSCLALSTASVACHLLSMLLCTRPPHAFEPTPPGSLGKEIMDQRAGEEMRLPIMVY